MSTPLSPAAQAVMDAMSRSYDHEETRRALAAAVLRAAVEQVLPQPIRLPRNSYAEGASDQRLNDHQRLLAIATELEATS